jgi:hypothetical protein
VSKHKGKHLIDSKRSEILSVFQVFPCTTQIALFLPKLYSLPFSLRILDIPALLRSWQKHYYWTVKIDTLLPPSLFHHQLNLSLRIHEGLPSIPRTFILSWTRALIHRVVHCHTIESNYWRSTTPALQVWLPLKKYCEHSCSFKTTESHHLYSASLICNHGPPAPVEIRWNLKANWLMDNSFSYVDCCRMDQRFEFADCAEYRCEWSRLI